MKIKLHPEKGNIGGTIRLFCSFVVAGLPVVPPEITMLLGLNSELAYFEDEVYPVGDEVLLAYVNISWSFRHVKILAPSM